MFVRRGSPATPPMNRPVEKTMMPSVQMYGIQTLSPLKAISRPVSVDISSNEQPMYARKTGPATV